MLRHKSVVYVIKASQVPKVEHWVILRSSGVSVPAEGEWAPGHGYPAHTEDFVSYEAYTDKAEFDEAVEHEVRDQSFYSKEFRVVHVTPLTVNTKVTVSVG